MFQQRECGEWQSKVLGSPEWWEWALEMIDKQLAWGHLVELPWRQEAHFYRGIMVPADSRLFLCVATNKKWLLTPPDNKADGWLGPLEEYR